MSWKKKSKEELWSAFRLLRSQSDKYFDELKAKYPGKGSLGFYEGKREAELIIELLKQ